MDLYTCPSSSALRRVDLRPFWGGVWGALPPEHLVSRTKEAGAATVTRDTTQSPCATFPHPLRGSVLAFLTKVGTFAFETGRLHGGFAAGSSLLCLKHGVFMGVLPLDRHFVFKTGRLHGGFAAGTSLSCLKQGVFMGVLPQDRHFGAANRGVFNGFCQSTLTSRHRAALVLGMSGPAREPDSDHTTREIEQFGYELASRHAEPVEFGELRARGPADFMCWDSCGCAYGARCDLLIELKASLRTADGRWSFTARQPSFWALSTRVDAVLFTCITEIGVSAGFALVPLRHRVFGEMAPPFVPGSGAGASARDTGLPQPGGALGLSHIILGDDDFDWIFSGYIVGPAGLAEKLAELLVRKRQAPQADWQPSIADVAGGPRRTRARPY